ncbi:MAG: tryptophan 2,3-dioxygenase family protein [Bacteroidota bacterium]
MKENAEKYSTIHYRNYLGLDKILNAQELRSEQLEEKPAHEEMLFIIVHQVYELWFKQIIHELESVLDLFDKDNVDEKNIGTSIHRLERVIEIQKLLVAQIRVMETMTPLDFLDFRNYLFPASGFQSLQFRMVENLLGLPEESRLTYNGCPYSSVFSESNQQKLKEIAESSSLFEAVHNWLERTPFLQIGEFSFLEQYKVAVSKMIEKEEIAIKNSPYLSTQEMEMRLQMLGNTDTYFQSVLDEQKHQEMVDKGTLRMSYKATLAALLINLYRDEPLLHLPFKMLTCLIEIDDALTTWRYRHAQMVQRMLGNKIGTGGSSGYAYLNETAVKHPIFKDLHNISTLLIPRSELPDLPDDIKRALGFYYSSIQNN